MQPFFLVQGFFSVNPGGEMYDHEILVGDESVERSYEHTCGNYEEGKPLHALNTRPETLEFSLLRVYTADTTERV